VAKPDWLRVKISNPASCNKVRDVLRSFDVRSVCDSSQCPNLSRCWSSRTVTFMIMGDRCSRACRFCAVHSGGMKPLDPDEPERLAKAVAELGLGYVVITSVTRDDLSDKGAGAFAETIRSVKKATNALVEVLVPDMGGDERLLTSIIEAGPDVLGHNIETAPRLQSLVRDPRASYEISLKVLHKTKEIDPSILTKSSIMLGLGETDEEIRTVLSDLRKNDVDIVTLGQYLRPGTIRLPVVRYVSPEEFGRWQDEAFGMGFRHVSSGPLVRSSFKAMEAYEFVKGGSKC
jgi:lipoyl synthase